MKKNAEITLQEGAEGLKLCAEHIREVLPDFTDKFQGAASENLFYGPMENIDWTNGFWTGEIWLAYEYYKAEAEKTGASETEDGKSNAQTAEKLKAAALLQCEDFHHRILNKIAVNHHDMGFLYSLSCVAAYKLTGNEDAKKAALMAADHLTGLYREKGEFIQSFDMPDCQEENRVIVDCLMNLPLLYWASEVTGDPKYRDIAIKNYKTTQKFIMREDGSAAQAILFDLETGAPIKSFTRQGYSDDSSWSRGQGWAIYGPAITYRYTGMEECKDMFRKAADYFMAHLPENMVPYFDLIITEGEEWPRDASAGAIAACGMLEMAKYLEAEEAAYYTSCAGKLIKAMYDHCMVRDFDKSNGLMMHSTYCCNTPYNAMTRDGGKDECCSFGDYFFMEALTRLCQAWDLYW